MKGYKLLLKVYAASVVFAFFGCTSSNGIKQVDVEQFTISIPDEWNATPGQGEDSFIGTITGPNIMLNFDCSDRGYANHLIQTEKDFLSSGGWRQQCHFCRTGVTYTDSANVVALQQSEMTMKQIKDPSLVKVEPFPVEKVVRTYLPTPEQKRMYPDADFMAEISNKDSVKSIPLTLPFDVKIHNVKIDSADKYIVKTVWPKTAGSGMTGVYIKSRSSDFNFQMNGIDLSPADQQLALEAFKTITFKK